MAKALGLIFLIDGQDVSAYASLEDVAFDVEPVDAKDHEFLICDADGRLVRLSTDRGFVTASLAEAEPTHAGELETALRKFLGTMNEPLAADQTCDLVCLVQTCHKFVKVTRRPKNISQMFGTSCFQGEEQTQSSTAEGQPDDRTYS